MLSWLLDRLLGWLPDDMWDVWLGDDASDDACLDGSERAAVRLMTGLSDAELDDLGGLP